jgi:hypothetical protein
VAPAQWCSTRHSIGRLGHAYALRGKRHLGEKTTLGPEAADLLPHCNLTEFSRRIQSMSPRLLLVHSEAYASVMIVATMARCIPSQHSPRTSAHRRAAACCETHKAQTGTVAKRTPRDQPP